MVSVSVDRIGNGPAGRLGLFLVVAWVSGCAPRTASEQDIPSGEYELEASLGNQSFPARLELIPVASQPWGRLTVAVGGEVVVAVRGIESTGTAWRFAVGGPVRGLEIEFTEPLTGTLTLGGAPPISLAGRRVGEVATPRQLRAHHVLEPLGLAARAGEEGASFPTGTPDGALIFARHGPDLSRQTLMRAAPSPDGWRDPAVFAGSGRYSDRSPAVMPDGSGIVFASDRPTGPDDDVEGYRLWFVPRTGPGDWGEPTPVHFEGGWEHDARQPSVTTDGRLYFSSDAPGGYGDGDIYAAAPVGPGRWAVPVNLGERVNGPGDEHGAFVAPDGSYMILVSAGERPGRAGGDDLYLAVRTADGWAPPVALELPVNTFGNEYGPWVSSADGHLYFTSDRFGWADIFRVDAHTAGLPGG